MLEPAFIEQLKGYFKDLESHYTLLAKVSPKHAKRSELIEILESLSHASPNISFEENKGNALEFIILKDGKETGIKYRSTPNGREFTSLILAILGADGKGKLPDNQVIERIRALRGPLKITTYVSLTCELCADVVESINLITLYNNSISHEIVDGGINKMEVIDREIRVLPTVYANDELLFLGKYTSEEIIGKLETK